jgi:hypothetical protein
MAAPWAIENPAPAPHITIVREKRLCAGGEVKPENYRTKPISREFSEDRLIRQRPTDKVPRWGILAGETGSGMTSAAADNERIPQ